MSAQIESFFFYTEERILSNSIYSRDNYSSKVIRYTMRLYVHVVWPKLYLEEVHVDNIFKNF